MIVGVGIDLVEIARIAAAGERLGTRFYRRLLRPAEEAYCTSHRHPAPHVAARFAVKEAVSKAFGTGIGARLGWHDIEVIRGAAGEPSVVLSGAGETLARERGVARIHVSLTHTATHAAAVVVLER